MVVFALFLTQACRKQNFVKHILTQSSFSMHLEFSQYNKWILDVDLKWVTNKNQQTILLYCHFEKVAGKLVQERSNIDAFLEALFEFSQLIIFTSGILVSSDKINRNQLWRFRSFARVHYQYRCFLRIPPTTSRIRKFYTRTLGNYWQSKIKSQE